MILCDRQIRKLCQQEQMIVPFDEEMLNPASLDIRCGSHIQLLVESGFKSFDISRYTTDNPYWLQPGDRVLVSSLEIFNMPRNVCGEFKLKSSRGREFYQHLLAGFIDPEFHDSHLTMELINQSLNRLKLYPGFRIGQIIFYQLSEIPDVSYRKKGRYNGDKKATQSKG